MSNNNVQESGSAYSKKKLFLAGLAGVASLIGTQAAKKYTSKDEDCDDVYSQKLDKMDNEINKISDEISKIDNDYNDIEYLYEKVKELNKLAPSKKGTKIATDLAFVGVGKLMKRDEKKNYLNRIKTERQNYYEDYNNCIEQEEERSKRNFYWNIGSALATVGTFGVVYGWNWLKNKIKSMTSNTQETENRIEQRSGEGVEDRRMRRREQRRIKDPQREELRNRKQELKQILDGIVFEYNNQQQANQGDGQDDAYNNQVNALTNVYDNNKDIFTDSKEQDKKSYEDLYKYISDKISENYIKNSLKKPNYYESLKNDEYYDDNTLKKVFKFALSKAIKKYMQDCVTSKIYPDKVDKLLLIASEFNNNIKTIIDERKKQDEEDKKKEQNEQIRRENEQIERQRDKDLKTPGKFVKLQLNGGKIYKSGLDVYNEYTKIGFVADDCGNLLFLNSKNTPNERLKTKVNNAKYGLDKEFQLQQKESYISNSFFKLKNDDKSKVCILGNKQLDDEDFAKIMEEYSDQNRQIRTAQRRVLDNQKNNISLRSKNKNNQTHY